MELASLFHHDYRKIHAVLDFSETDIAKLHVYEDKENGLSCPAPKAFVGLSSPASVSRAAERNGSGISDHADATPRRRTLRSHNRAVVPVVAQSPSVAILGGSNPSAQKHDKVIEFSNHDLQAYLPYSRRPRPGPSRTSPGVRRISPIVSDFLRSLWQPIPGAANACLQIGITHSRHLDAIARKAQDMEGSRAFFLDLREEFEKRGIVAEFIWFLEGLRLHVFGEMPAHAVPAFDPVAEFLGGLDLDLSHHLDVLKEVYFYDEGYLDFITNSLNSDGAEYLLFYLREHKKLSNITPLEWLFLIHGIIDRKS